MRLRTLRKVNPVWSESDESVMSGAVVGCPVSEQLGCGGAREESLCCITHGRFNHGGGGGVSQCPCPDVNAPVRRLSVAPPADSHRPQGLGELLPKKKSLKLQLSPIDYKTPLLPDWKWRRHCHICVTQSDPRKGCARETNWCYPT